MIIAGIKIEAGLPFGWPAFLDVYNKPEYLFVI